MCAGGGGGGGVITMPDTRAYDRMADAQIRAMESARDGALSLKQQELQATLSTQQQTLERLNTARMARANETAANAARMAELLGPPMPEESAKPPVIGDNRTAAAKARNRSTLRIDRRTTATPGQGSGLNIS
jgi:hypothetical protein